MIVTIVENSWLARVAAWKMGTDSVAMVLGSKIHLCNCTKQQFLQNKKWVRHEIAHVHQWKQYGRLRFLILYCWESFNKGYYYNKFEVEARSKENDQQMMQGITIL